MSDEQHRIAGVLPTAAAVEDVIGALESMGFDRSQFGVLADRRVLALGEGAADQAEDPKVHTEADIFPEVEGAVAGGLIGGLSYAAAAVAGGAVLLTGGGLGVAIAAVLGAGSAGGLVGALVANGFHNDHARVMEEQIALGGVVLWIQPRDDAQARSAVSQLKIAGADKVVVPDLS